MHARPCAHLQALRAWLRAYPPLLSANSHGGFLTANYVLDACDTLVRHRPPLGEVGRWGGGAAGRMLHAAHACVWGSCGSAMAHGPCIYARALCGAV